MIKLTKNDLFGDSYFNLVKIIIVLSVVILFCSGTTNSQCGGGSFEAQVQLLLSKQMMTQSEIANLSIVFHKLQDTLQELWPGCQVVPIGSVITGLTMKLSDADCMVTIPEYSIYNDTVGKTLILQAEQLLKNQPELYNNVSTKFRSDNRVSILRFNFVPTRTNCDVNVISTHGLEISRMIAYYYSSDERALTVAAIVKLWARIDQNKPTTLLTSYSMNLLVIFYLQQEKVLPPYQLIENPLDRGRLLDWSPNIMLCVYQLLGGFFKYYREFNFEDYVVSALLGRPVPKQEFRDIYGLPSDMTSDSENYNKNNVSYVRNVKMYIQDVVSPRSFVAESTLSRVDDFIKRCHFAATMFQQVPSDRFLRIIFMDNSNFNYLIGAFNDSCI